MTPDQFLKALAMTESDDDPEEWGDHDHAVGRYQVHPDWLWTWAHHYLLMPNLNESWDSFIARVVRAFFVDHIRLADEFHVAMYFHLGHPTRPDQADWDYKYSDRFTKAAAEV